MKSERSRRLHPAPPELGVRAALLLGFVIRRPQERWPVGEIIREVGLAPAHGWESAQRLLRLGMIERLASDDGVIRVRATPAGKRAYLSRPYRVRRAGA